MKRHSWWIAAAALGVVACAGPVGSPSASPTPSRAPAVDRAGAPPILTPRNLAPRAADPCGVLSASQLANLGVRPPGERGVDALGAPRCTWSAGRIGSRSLEISIVQSGDLFVDTYRNRVLPIFRPHEIDGLPAVDVKGIEDDTACTTTVGVADGQSLDIDVARGTYAGERDADTCAIGRRAAEAVVSTLPPL